MATIVRSDVSEDLFDIVILEAAAAGTPARYVPPNWASASS